MTPLDKTMPVDVLALLDEALQIELGCVLRYKRQYLQVAEIRFLQYAHDEQTHARHIAQRIVELGGTPNPYLEGSLSPGHNHVERQFVIDMMIDDVIAARLAIDAYQQLLLCVATEDSATRKLLEGVLADKEKQAEELLCGMKDVVVAPRRESNRSTVSTFSSEWPLS